MSLDVYLDGPPREVGCECPECFNEHMRVERDVYYTDNIKHHLIPMAREAGIYEAVWRPEECGITKAGQLIEPLRRAVESMKADPARYKAHDSPNGWGLYKHFLPWLTNYLAACEKNPEARPRASR